MNLLERISRPPAVPASTAEEVWHQNGFNLCEVIVIRDGPAPDGTRYQDGRHAIRVALFEAQEDAAEACKRHNAALAPVAAPHDYSDFYG